MTPELRAQIQKAIDSHEVLLFLKGTREAPSCGFSSRSVEILDSLLEHYQTVDVLAHPEIREGIKEYSSWPTIPQLYVRGEFLGGADLITQMFESGDLHEKLGLEGKEARPPHITITERAAEAFKNYLTGTTDVILLDISKDYFSGLSLGPRPERALVSESQGLFIAMDRLTAGRAEGLTIDFIDTPDGTAFKLDNPNEPAELKAISVQALKARLDQKEPLRLIDVRSPGEWETARIEGAELLDSQLYDELMDLPKNTPLFFLCHHGHRSARAAEQFVAQGFREVFNVTGGIDAWSQEVDANVPRY